MKLTVQEKKRERGEMKEKLDFFGFCCRRRLLRRGPSQRIGVDCQLRTFEFRRPRERSSK